MDKQYHKDYYEKNKEKFILYRIENKEKISLQRKEFRLNNNENSI